MVHVNRELCPRFSAIEATFVVTGKTLIYSVKVFFIAWNGTIG